MRDTILRLIAISSSVLSLPLCATVSKTIMSLPTGRLLETREGERLPRLTEFWIGNFAQSSNLLFLGYGIALIFAISLILIWRKPKAGERRTTLLILIPSMAFICSILLIMTTIVAMLLPVFESVMTFEP